MPFLLKNLVMLHVFALAAGLAWVHGGTRVDHLGWVPWLALACLEWMLLLPPVRRGETLDEARRRVWRGLARDPFLYVALALALFLLLQWAHGGLGMAYDASRGMAVPQLPRIRWLPWCIERGEAVQLLYWFPPACAALLAVRHGVTRRGQRLLLQLLVWNAGLLSLFGIVQSLSGTRALFWLTPLPAHFFASFGYPNHAGAFFALTGAVGLGLWAQEEIDPDVHTLLRRRLTLVATLLCWAGIWWSRSRAAVLLSTVLLLAAAGYLLAYLWRRMGWGARIQALAGGTAAVTAALLVYYVIYPANPVRQKMAAIDFSSLGSAMGSIQERWLLVPAAMRIWQDHPWYGVGGWGFRSFVAQYLDRADLPKLNVGWANVHSDGMQFLAEHGIVGSAMILGVLGLVAAAPIRGLWRVRRVSLLEENQSRVWLFRASPAALLLLAGAAGTVVHSAVDLPFRCPAVLVAWMLGFACVAALMPRDVDMTTDASRRASSGNHLN